MTEEIQEDQKQVSKKIKAEIPPIPTDLDLLVVDMDKVLYEGKVKSVIAPGPQGNFAVLPGHTPLFAKLIGGKILIDSGGREEELEIGGGIAKITQYKMTVLCGFEEKEILK